MRFGSRSRPPAPATRLRRTSGRPNFAASLATTRSQARTSSNPPASAYPSTAAMTGLAGGRCTIPPNPRSSNAGESPDRKPFRSIPELNVPPAPVRIRTCTSFLASRSSTAPAIPRATSPLTAFLASGRLMVMTATPSLTSVRTAGIGCDLSLLRLEPDAAVESDDLGVHVVVLNQRADQVRELSRRAHPLGEHDRGDQLRLEVLAAWGVAVDRRVDDAGADRVDADADGRQVPGRRNRHTDDAAFGRRVGELASLAFDAGDRSGVDDHAACPVGIGRLGLGDRCRADAHEVECADQIDVDDLAEGRPVVRRAVPAHGSLCPADARAVDDEAQRRASGRRHLDGRSDRLGITNVGPDELTADLVGKRFAEWLVEVSDDYRGAGRSQRADRCRTQPASPAGHDCSGSVDFHGREHTSADHAYPRGVLARTTRSKTACPGLREGLDAILTSQ